MTYLRFLIAAVLVFAGAMVLAQCQAEADGCSGTLVRGVLGWTCIEGDR